MLISSRAMQEHTPRMFRTDKQQETEAVAPPGFHCVQI
jgi:hypothetical protein